MAEDEDIQAGGPGWPKARRVAYHEAGHAVALYCTRRRFVRVTIVPEELHDGRIRAGHVKAWEGNAPGEEFVKDVDFVWHTAGGVIADRIDRGRADFTIWTIRNWHRYDGWLEQHDVQILIREFPDRARLLFLVQYAARRTLTAWPQIEAVATTLIERGTLDYDEVEAVCAQANAA